MKKIIVAVIVLLLGACGGGGGGGSSCGGLENLACGEGQYCKFDALNCSAADAQGTCEAIPASCDATLSQVCTCDSLVFDNECFAAQAGQSVSAAGDCA